MYKMQTSEWNVRQSPCQREEDTVSLRSEIGQHRLLYVMVDRLTFKFILMKAVSAKGCKVITVTTTWNTMWCWTLTHHDLLRFQFPAPCHRNTISNELTTWPTRLIQTARLICIPQLVGASFVVSISSICVWGKNLYRLKTATLI